jgi:polyketide biosynthesis acyl carrier protein
LEFGLRSPIDMTNEEIFAIIKRNLLEILPDLDGDSIRSDQSMKDLGANSVDRMDVVIQTKEELGLTFPLHELGGVENLQGLIDFFSAKRARAS